MNSKLPDIITRVGDGSAAGVRLAGASVRVGETEGVIVAVGSEGCGIGVMVNVDVGVGFGVSLKSGVTVATAMAVVGNVD
jgi:pantoate kinase